MVEGLAVATLWIIGKASQQRLDQGFSISGKYVTQRVSILLKPLQHQGSRGRGIEADPIGESTVAGWIVGQHQGNLPLGGWGLAQADPVGSEQGDPGQPLRIRLVALQGSREAATGTHRFLEGPYTGSQAAIQLGQGHLQGQVNRPQADTAGLPPLPGLAATEQLEHRHPQPLPEGGTEPRLLKLHRGK